MVILKVTKNQGFALSLKDAGYPQKIPSTRSYSFYVVVFCARPLLYKVFLNKIMHRVFQHLIRVTVFQYAISMRNVIECSYKLIETKRVYMIKVKETLPCDDTYVSSKLLSCK